MMCTQKWCSICFEILTEFNSIVAQQEVLARHFQWQMHICFVVKFPKQLFSCSSVFRECYTFLFHQSKFPNCHGLWINSGNFSNKFHLRKLKKKCVINFNDTASSNCISIPRSWPSKPCSKQCNEKKLWPRRPVYVMWCVFVLVHTCTLCKIDAHRSVLGGWLTYLLRLAEIPLHHDMRQNKWKAVRE